MNAPGFGTIQLMHERCFSSHIYNKSINGTDLGYPAAVVNAKVPHKFTRYFHLHLDVENLLKGPLHG